MEYSKLLWRKINCCCRPYNQVHIVNIEEVSTVCQQIQTPPVPKLVTQSSFSVSSHMESPIAANSQMYGNNAQMDPAPEILDDDSYKRLPYGGVYTGTESGSVVPQTSVTPATIIRKVQSAARSHCTVVTF